MLFAQVTKRVVKEYVAVVIFLSAILLIGVSPASVYAAPFYGYTYIFGGLNGDVVYATGKDDSNNVYLTGYFSGTVDFDPTSGTDSKTSSVQNLFVTKINADGTYGTTYVATPSGPLSYANGYSVAVDHSGNVYVSGIFRGTVNFNMVGGTDNKTSIGTGLNFDSFLTKINSNGTYGYTYTWGATNNAVSSGKIAIDLNNKVHLYGSYNGTTNFDPTGGSDSKTAVNSNDFYLISLNSNGSYIGTFTWSPGFPSSTEGITTDGNNNIFITGSFRNSTDFNPTGGTDTKTGHGNGTSDVFITKINADRTYGWTYQFGDANGWAEGWAIKTDSNNNIYLGGNYENQVDFDPTSGTDLITGDPNWNDNIFVTKINSNATYGFTYTQAPSTGFNNYIRNMAIDSNNNIYVQGEYQGTVNFDRGGSDSHSSNADTIDIFVTKLNANQSYGTTYAIGGNTDDFGGGIVVDSNNNIYYSGYFSDVVNFNPLGGSDSQTSNGNTDIFLTQLLATASSPPPPLPPPSPPPSPPPASNNSNSGSQSNSDGLGGCSSEKPTGVPNLFQIDLTANTARLYFSPSGKPYDHYFVAYGRSPQSEEYGGKFALTNFNGVTSYSVSSLNANTTYYFKVRAGNNCATGGWSNVLAGITNFNTVYKDQTSHPNDSNVQSKFLANNSPKSQVNKAVTPLSVKRIAKPIKSKAPKKCFLFFCW